MTPDHYAYDCLETPYIQQEDIEIHYEDGMAVIVCAVTEFEIARLSALISVDDIQTIFALLNKAFRDGRSEGREEVRGDVLRALCL
jgi:hypothetical protein